MVMRVRQQRCSSYDSTMRIRAAIIKAIANITDQHELTRTVRGNDKDTQEGEMKKVVFNSYQPFRRIKTQKNRESKNRGFDKAVL